MLMHEVNLKILNNANYIVGYDVETMEIFEMDKITADVISNDEEYVRERYSEEVIQEKVHLIQGAIADGFLSTKNSLNQSLEKKYLINGQISYVELALGDVFIPQIKKTIPRISFDKATEVVTYIIEEQLLSYISISFLGTFDEDAIKSVERVAKFTDDIAQKNNIDVSYLITLTVEDLCKRELVNLIYTYNFHVNITIEESNLYDKRLITTVSEFNKTLYDRKSYTVYLQNPYVEETVDILEKYGIQNYWIQYIGNEKYDMFTEQFCKVGQNVLDNYLMYGTIPQNRYIRDSIRRLGTMQGPKIFGCLSGRNKITVYENGKILPCKNYYLTPHYDMGDYVKLDREVQRNFLNQNCFQRKKCFDCWCKYLCGGFCEINFVKNPNNDQCKVIEKLSETAILLYGLMLSKKSTELDGILLQDI